MCPVSHAVGDVQLVSCQFISVNGKAFDFTTFSKEILMRYGDKHNTRMAP